MPSLINRSAIPAAIVLLVVACAVAANAKTGKTAAPSASERATQTQTTTRRPADVVNVADVVPGVVVDARYAGYFNFVGHPIAGYEAPVCLLTRKAAEALARVQAALKPVGLGLKMYDCYRPTRAVAEFVRWAKDLQDTRMKAEFYPELDKSQLFPQGYIAEKSSHSRGSTADLTLVVLPAKIDVYMGTGFDFFSRRSWPDDLEQPAQARANRLLLSSLMQLHGFKPYPYEWWHFTLADEPYPDTYFDFPVK
ncbi:MAG: M15 family metallopeptidase [Methylocystis sp.]|uniref:M15 family metallopeptidase n=1 Tax=Methylocystis sp. TaxID=1911079 RepID=UPI003D0A6EA5